MKFWKKIIFFRKIITPTGLMKYSYNQEEVLFAKDKMKVIDGELMPVKIKGDIWTDIGINNLHNEGGIQFPNGKKPVKLTQRVFEMLSGENQISLDYFGGSGTTGHGVINLNRKDNSKRKYILVEMGEYFNTVTKPRIQKVIYSENWKGEKPTDRKGSSHLFKYIRLESYEDALNNLRLQRTENQQGLLNLDNNLYEEYLLSYALDVESRGSLLSVDDFQKPFDYQLNITADNETSLTKIDLVETFNYLIGLKVQQIQTESGFKTVKGTNKKGQSVLVIWRNQTENDNEALAAFFQSKHWDKVNNGFDLIYINGSNTVEMHKEAGATWKILSTEEAFTRLMFDVKEV
ncbi:MAG: site-specific DNA-methyltransferase [Saprospiraceae bacterium]|nr:site-specific DNA-methyltransferase [Saprospiraceae bacterium]